MTRQSYLKEELEAGASRVFNVLHSSEAIEKADGKRDQLLFNTSALNRVIFFKETATEHTFDGEAGRSLTKLYAPYNEEVPHEGGASIFVEDAVLDRVLEADFGFDRSRDPEGTARDLQVIYMLRDLPTLDPFLLKDKAELEELSIDARYLEMDAKEERMIQNHIIQRFRAMIEFAFGDEADSEKGKQRLVRLVRTLWECSDMNELKPIIKALDLPEDEAKPILYAWKGVLYYDFRLRRLQPRVDKLFNFLRRECVPRETPTRSQVQNLKESRDATLRELAQTWAAANSILNNYNDAYDKLFRKRESPKPFIQFMQSAQSHFWELGKSLARADHAQDLWRLTTERSDEDRLKYEDLIALLNAITQILRGR